MIRPSAYTESSGTEARFAAGPMHPPSVVTRRTGCAPASGEGEGAPPGVEEGPAAAGVGDEAPLQAASRPTKNARARRERRTGMDSPHCAAHGRSPWLPRRDAPRAQTVPTAVRRTPANSPDPM